MSAASPESPSPSPSASSTSAARPDARRVLLAFATDLVLVLVFVLIGRRSHDEDSAVLGLLTTLWPFAAGLAVGWSVSRAWRAPTRIRPTGLVVWGSTVLVGMFLRVVSGQGVQLSFVIVTLLVLAAFLLGWRAVVRLVARRRRRN